MSSSQITAILPCYNHEKFLRERINSVLSQSLLPSEILFLDDASSDNSFEIARAILSNSAVPVSFYRNPVNSGSPFTQWNKGISLSRCQYIWIAETDDSCNPELLATLYKQIVETKSILSFCRSLPINELGSPLQIKNNRYITSDLDLFEHHFKVNGRAFNHVCNTKTNCIANASAVLFQREAYLVAGMANSSMRYCGDWDLWWRILQHGNIVYTPKPLNYFRTHSESTRFKGGIPEKYVSEVIACVFLFGNHMNSNVLATKIAAKNVDLRLGFNFLSKPSLLFPLLRGLNCLPSQTFSEMRASYSCLRDVPQVSPKVWRLISWIHVGVVRWNILRSYLRRTIKSFTWAEN